MNQAARHILFVGLSDTERRLLREAVGTFGHSFQNARGRREALDLIGAFEPSVVISRIIIAEGNGYDLCREIKENLNLSHIGFVLMGDTDEEYDTVRGLMAQVDLFFSRRTSIEVVSERTLELAERMEEQTPTAMRASTINRNRAEKRAVDESFGEPIMVAGRDAVQGAADEFAPRESLSQAQPQPESIPETDLELRDPMKHPLGELMLDKQALAIPLEEQAETSPLPDVLRDRLEKLPSDVSDGIVTQLEEWLQLHFGQRVDETLRREIRPALKPLLHRLIQNAINKAMEE